MKIEITANNRVWNIPLPGPRFLAAVFAVVVALGFASRVSAAAPEDAFAKIQKEVASKPAKAADILKHELESLSPTDRQRLASGVLASVLKGVDKPTCDQVRDLFKVAVTAVPKSATALLDVAFQACPSSIAAFTEIAIRAVQAAGLADMIPSIVARAVALAPNQQTALTRLALALAPESLADRIVNAIAAALAQSGRNEGGLGALGGTINPANIGGGIVSPAD
jgi:hypothetical protein